MRKVYDTATGRFKWVNDDGSPFNVRNDPLGVNPGMGSLPGRALAREADIMSRLPDAELAGLSGPTVVPPQPRFLGARPGAPPPTDDTIRVLSGLPAQSRGNAVIIAAPNATGETGERSIIEMRSRGEDAENLIVALDISLEGFDEDDFSWATSVRTGLFVRCNLLWGIGGASFSAVCDWQQGTLINIPANFVRVGAQMLYQQLFPGPPAVPPQARLNVGLSYGNISPRASNARYTEFFLLQGGATQTFRIPKYATSFTVLTEAATPNLSILTYPAPAQTVEVIGHTNNQLNGDGQFPIPNGARVMAVTNNGARTVVSVLFTLAF